MINRERNIEEYLEDIDALAQEVVDTWAENLRAGNAELLGDDFKILFDKAFEYREAKIVVENHRELKILTPAEAVCEQTARLIFAEIYKSYWENRNAAS